MELTSSFLDLLPHFAPVFTAPTYQTFLVIVAGWVLSQRHRFITEVIFSGGHVGTGLHYDPLISSRSKALVSWGHDWVVLCLILVHPWWAPTKVFALPIAARLYRNRQGLTKGKKSKGKSSKAK